MHYFYMHNLTRSPRFLILCKISTFPFCSFPSPPHSFFLFLTLSQSSNVIVILTFCASMLCCCSIITLCCSCKVVAYMSLVAIAISVLVYFVLAAWVGLGTMMADTHTCAKYSLYLTLFYAYFLVLLAFCITSALWKTNRLSGKKMARRKHNGRMD